MKNHESLIGALFDKTEHYLESSAELYKLKAIDKSADVISNLTMRLAIIVFITLFFLILNVGVALLIGEMLGKSYYGFFIVAGFYALVGAVLYVFRNKWIKAPLRDSIIKQFLN